MPVDLLTVTEAAKEFLQKGGHIFVALQSAAFDQPNRQWILQFDVGLSKPQRKRVILDDSGKVLSLE